MSDRLRFHEDIWDIALRWDRRGGRIRMGMDPYRPMPEIIEREAGEHLNECFACRSFREAVRETLVEFEGETRPVPTEVCAACRAKFGLP